MGVPGVPAVFFRNLNSPDLFVEGWDGLFIWPEDIPRAEPHRERWGTRTSGVSTWPMGSVAFRNGLPGGPLGSGMKVKPGSPEGVGLEILVGNLVVSTHPPELERMDYQR